MDSNQLEANASNDSNQSPQLLAVLKEMKSGLDTVRAKVQALTQKVSCDPQSLIFLHIC